MLISIVWRSENRSKWCVCSTADSKRRIATSNGIDDVPRIMAHKDPLSKNSNNTIWRQRSMNLITIRATSCLEISPRKQLPNWRSSTRRLATMASPVRPRRFAPLNTEKRSEGDKRPVLKGIVFDVDGTLCLPQNYMFGEMRYVCAWSRS